MVEIVNTDTFTERFKALQACIIIPTYNNAITLAEVIASVLQYCNDVIVVNDGSTDNTVNVVQNFPHIQVISYSKNTGKGWALRKAFEYAIAQGYQYAITIDADGQHLPKDLPAFIDKAESTPHSIIVGARNMAQASVPGKSSFGYKFSNFWFKVETGISCPDTQSGYRLYPLQRLKNMQFITRKYEFETEILVRAAWKGIQIESIPVNVYYPPASERVSHFKPFRDFFRISVLNTVLVLIAFFYIKPKNFFKLLFIKKNFRDTLKEHLFRSHHSHQAKAASVAFGIFMGIVPIWGFQLLTAVFLAALLRLNKVLVIIAANISIPPMIPIIIFFSYKLGGFWMGANAMPTHFNRDITLTSVTKNLTQYIYGSITLAVVAAIVFGILTFILLKLFHKKPVGIT